jgi:hypothetical protein
MMEFLAGIFGVVTSNWSIATILTGLLLWIFKKIPAENTKEAVKTIFGNAGYALGVAMTLGLSKWKITRHFWNKAIEPWFINFIKNVLAYSVQVFLVRWVDGLQSDNPETDE